MNGLPLRWKLFRIMCILQLVIVLYSLVIHGIRLFNGKNILGDLIGVISYALVFLFLCQALSILSENYPDTPLTVSQKRRFNLLFLVNFILIAFLFAKTVYVWQIIPLITISVMRGNQFFTLLFYIFQSIVVFISHLIFLYGMYRLRQLIYQNTVTGWYQQFDGIDQP